MDNYVNRRKKLFLVIVIAYLILLTVVCVTRFSMFYTILGNPPTRVYSSNLVPFSSILSNWRRIGRLSWDAFGNLVMFIPLGVIFSFYQKKKSLLIASACCLLTSVGIEVFQYFFKTGAVDVDDIILNTVGGLIGVLAYWLIDIYCRKRHFLTSSAIEICTTIFPPFLLFYVADMTWRAGSYHFYWWHVLPIIAYFVIVHCIFLRDFTLKQNIMYYLSVLLFAVYFFAFFL